MTILTGTTAFRIVCDRLGCSGVLHHEALLDEEDADELPMAAIRRAFPPVDEDGHHLCEACRERLGRGELEITWRRR